MRKQVTPRGERKQNGGRKQITPCDDFGPDSRIVMLADVLARRLPRYFLGVTPDRDAEEAAILFVALEILPPADPPSQAEVDATLLIQRHVACSPIDL